MSGRGLLRRMSKTIKFNIVNFIPDGWELCGELQAESTLSLNLYFDDEEKVWTTKRWEGCYSYNPTCNLEVHMRRK